MAKHTTNYFDTFIEVSEDCRAEAGSCPPSKGTEKTIAEMQYEMLVRHPYKYTSDDVLFTIFAERNGLVAAEYGSARSVFFSRGRACLRTSPLAKRYGFGIHANAEGRVAIYGRETVAYEVFLADSALRHVKAMRQSRR